MDSACEVYKQLRDYYPDNEAYYSAIERCAGIDTGAEAFHERDLYKRNSSRRYIVG